MKHINLIDYLRGYSIFTIVLMHLCMGYAGETMHKALAFGGAGVHVFILCSGFGLYLSYLKKPLGYGDFLKRRFGRVWIPYAIAVLLWGVWYVATKGYCPLKEIASHLFLYKMFSTELDTSLCYPYWFVSTIIQFYLAWPMVVNVFRMKWGGADFDNPQPGMEYNSRGGSVLKKSVLGVASSYSIYGSSDSECGLLRDV